MDEENRQNARKNYYDTPKIYKPPAQEDKHTHRESGKPVKTSFVDPNKLPDEIYRTMSAHMVQVAKQVGVAHGECADVAQKAWLHAFQKREQFHGQTMEELRAWLTAIARNVALDELRRIDRHPTQSLDATAVEPMDEREVERDDVAEWNECLTKWLARLQQEEPENWRLVCAHYLEGKTIQELADETGRTPHAISNRLYRALQKLHTWGAKSFPDDLEAS